MKDRIQELNKIIKKLKEVLPDNSYTSDLLKAGENKIIKKLGEEFSELIMASAKKDNENFVYESVDFIYHYLVLLNYLNITLEKVYEEIERRFK